MKANGSKLSVWFVYNMVIIIIPWLIVKLHSLIYNDYQDLGNAVPYILYSITITIL